MKKRVAEHVNHERWMVSYADFITLLFAVFTILYALSTLDQKKADKLRYSMRAAFDLKFLPNESGVTGSAPAESRLIAPIDFISWKGDGSFSLDPKEEQKQFEIVQKALAALAAQDDMKGVISVHKDKRGLIVSLYQAHFFKSAVADLSSAGLPPLDRVIATVAKKNLNLIVEGHTDDVPISNGRFKNNWELSTARATSVVSYFIDRHSITPGRVTAAGYAQYRPVGDNKTEEGRRQNRRTDVVIVAPQPRPGSALGIAPNTGTAESGVDSAAVAAPTK